MTDLPAAGMFRGGDGWGRARECGSMARTWRGLDGVRRRVNDDDPTGRLSASRRRGPLPRAHYRGWPSCSPSRSLWPRDPRSHLCGHQTSTRMPADPPPKTVQVTCIWKHRPAPARKLKDREEVCQGESVSWDRMDEQILSRRRLSRGSPLWRRIVRRAFRMAPGDPRHLAR